MLGVLLVAVLAGCITPAPAEFSSELFQQYVVRTGTAQHQTILVGFFRGAAVADLAVINFDNNGKRQLRIYGFENGGWERVLDVPLRPGVLFADLANIDGRDRLITYERGRVNWFDPDSVTEQVLVEITTHYNATDESVIPHLDITRDLNHDGLDDLVVPDIDGFWIATQLNNGVFTEALQLGPPEPFLDAPGLDDSGISDSRSYREVGITKLTLPLYQSRVHAADYNQDGRSDLVFWNEDHFDVYTQDGRGLFSPVAGTFTVDVPFDSEGVYSRMFDFSEDGALSLLFGLNEHTKKTVLHSLRDMNGDGVADLVTLTLAGRSPLRQRSLYQVHFGAPTPNGILFARDAGTTIQPRGKAGAGQPWGYASRWFEDFDGDDQVDIMLLDVTIGFGGMFRALAANSIGIDLEFYRMNGGIYPTKPNAARKIRSDADIFHRTGPHFPTVLHGDVNGDKHADLLVSLNRRELLVYFGEPGAELFSQHPQIVAVDIPANEQNVRLVDFNKDGKQDILLHYPSKTDAHRLTLLMAN